MNHTAQRLSSSAAMAALLLLAVGCKTTPQVADANAKPEVKVAEGEVRMPSSYDRMQARMVEEGRRAKVYTSVGGMGDPSNEKLLFPPQVAQALGLTPAQIQRRFNDTIGKTKRYEVLELGASVVADQSDYVVDSMVTSATQELRRIEGGVRVAVTKVQLNVKLKSQFDESKQVRGFQMPDLDVFEAVGETGAVTGDRVTLLPSENENSPEVQRRLGIDYERALQRAFNKVAQKVEAQLRPQGRVMSVDGSSVGISGGIRNGLQGGDEMVVFRATVGKLGDREQFVGARPLVAVRCYGVGSATSQCEVIRRDPRYQVQVGDFAVLTDASANGTRTE